MYPGVAIALVGAGLVTFTEAYWTITLGTFLVGLGWAAANVAATAFIADQTETPQRGRAIGVNDSIAGAVTVLTALATGPLVQWSGLPAAGLTRGAHGVGAARDARGRSDDSREGRVDFLAHSRASAESSGSVLFDVLGPRSRGG